MVMRRLPAVLILVGFTSGCVVSTRQGRGVAIFSGLGLVATSFAIRADVQSDPEADHACEDFHCVLVPALLVSGIVLALSGVFANVEDGDDPAEPPVEAPPAPPPSPAFEVRPLPEVPTDDATLRLAKQARSAAHVSNCGVVRVMLREIAARDRRYHAALVAGPVIEGCR